MLRLLEHIVPRIAACAQNLRKHPSTNFKSTRGFGVMAIPEGLQKNGTTLVLSRRKNHPAFSICFGLVISKKRWKNHQHFEVEFDKSTSNFLSFWRWDKFTRGCFNYRGWWPTMGTACHPQAVRPRYIFWSLEASGFRDGATATSCDWINHDTIKTRKLPLKPFSPHIVSLDMENSPLKKPLKPHPHLELLVLDGFLLELQQFRCRSAARERPQE